MTRQTYVEVAQVAKEHAGILEKGVEFARGDITLRHQGVPLPTASMVKVHDEVEDVWTLRGNLSHYDSASMPCRSCKVVCVELLTRSEGIENRLHDEMVDCGTGGGSMRALGGRHGA